MWYKKDQKNLYLTVIAKPNAKRSAVVRAEEDGLYIALHAKPHQGEANAELCAFLAKQLGVPKSQVVVLKGETSRYKRVALPLDAPIDLLVRDLNK